jgi:hypothetical protein
MVSGFDDMLLAISLVLALVWTRGRGPSSGNDEVREDVFRAKSERSWVPCGKNEDLAIVGKVADNVEVTDATLRKSAGGNSARLFESASVQRVFGSNVECLHRNGGSKESSDGGASENHSDGFWLIFYRGRRVKGRSRAMLYELVSR